MMLALWSLAILEGRGCPLFPAPLRLMQHRHGELSAATPLYPGPRTNKDLPGLVCSLGGQTLALSRKMKRFLLGNAHNDDIVTIDR